MKKLLIFFVIASMHVAINAQVGINNDNPDSSAILDIKHDTKGVLIPRVSSKDNVDMPRQTSLVIFDKSDDLFYYWDGTDWQMMNPTPLGGIIMWSGKIPPKGWVLCDGTKIPNDTSVHTSMKGKSTPDLRGRFIVGYDKDDEDYDETGNLSSGLNTIGKTGPNTSNDNFTIDNKGKSIILKTGAIPSHNHSVSISNTDHTHESGSLATNSDGTHTHALFIERWSVEPKSKDGLTMRNIQTSYLSNVEFSTTTANNGEPGDMGKHSHSMKGSTGGNNITPTINQTNIGGNKPHENRPPYYVLAFIMRVR